MDSNTSPHEGTIQLHDGRRLGFRAYGPPDGPPVLFFHGWPSSRHFLSMWNAPKEGKHRLIALERPGFGLSDLCKDRKVADWAADVREFCDSQNIGKFAVVGHSGGGPYVAACAAKLSERITSMTILSGFGPIDHEALTRMMPANRFLFNLARKARWIHRMLLWLMAKGGTNKLITNMTKSLPEVDKQVFSKLQGGEADIDAAFCQGSIGPALDQQVLVRQWGVQLSEIRVPAYLWHGDQDVMVPLCMGQAVASQIPRCEKRVCTQEGHMLLVPHWNEIMAQVSMHM